MSLPEQAPGFYPNLPSGTGKKSTRTTQFFKPASVKLDNLEILTGHDNFDDWARQMKMVFVAMGSWDIVHNGATPATDADEEEEQAYRELSRQALLTLIQLVSKPILRQITLMDSAASIWLYLQETYYRNTAFSFVHQLTTFFALVSSYDSSKPIH